MNMLLWFWNEFLGIPLAFLANTLGFDVVTPWKAMAWKIAIIVVALLLIYETYLRLRRSYRKRILREQTLTPEEAGALVADSRFRDTIEATRDPGKVIAQLKREKRWADLGAVYGTIKRHKSAAYYYKKAGELNNAANELARAGKTVAAARLLQKAGEHAMAARFYMEKKKYKQAARAYEKAQDIPNAAAAYGMAGRSSEAYSAFKRYFDETRSPAESLAAAEACYQFLQSDKAAKLEGNQKQELKGLVAEAFARDQRLDLAASLFLEAGNPGRAGEVFLQAGRLEESAKAFQAAGRTKEAAEIGGRYYESKGRWREAAMAYEGAQQFRKAGDCFSKAQDAAKAAACYEHAGEFFGAGLALVHLKQHDKAITSLQKVREDHPRFSESRALLGRCFYEMKDYAHSAATLENYLTGEKVTSDNKDYFYMLALALEQLGELQKSRELLLKIRSVDVEFRDVSRRLSNIETRISLVQSGAQPAPSNADEPARKPDTAVMELVESSVGDRYKLERELGRGGMGVVYEARDKQLERKVAIKFLGSLVDGSDEYRERFIREARAAARVNHPNIIGIYDIGTDQGKVFIAMEYIEGPNLHKYLQKKGKLEPREAVNIIGQACSALEAVHQAGIIHRDIKPDNILIAQGGLVKLMDFGLAKSDAGKLTGTNVVMGTPCYMSPEQAQGKPVDARADIYAMGLVLYELLTGETVFLDGDVLNRQVNEMPPPPSAKRENVPEILDQIVMKCIAKKPEERFQSARELIDQLRKVGK